MPEDMEDINESPEQEAQEEAMSSGNFMEAIKEPPKEKKDEFNDATDKFSESEQKEIVKLVVQDIEADERVQVEWVEQRKHALKHKNGEKPSVIENITKKSWQSDRNLGVGAAISDSYQSTLLATCWNPDSIHFVATCENDVDNKDNLEKFAKVIVGKNHANMTPEVDDFIQNKIDQGFSIFEIYRLIEYDWVDRQIPIYDREGNLERYETKTEKIRIEKGVVENIDNLDDILLPRWGDDLQRLPHIIRIVHLTGDQLLGLGESGQLINVDEKMIEKFKSQAGLNRGGIEEERAKNLSLEDSVDEEFRALPIDIYKWYGWYTKNGKREKYRFLVERKTETFLSGKPLRKITRSGKFPFVGGPFERIPGQIRGKDIFMLIEDPINALNEVYNQKADFQYVTNCPFGFHKANEGYTKNVYDLEPGVSYPTEGNPSEDVFFPNIQRSMAWAEQDMRILFEVIEKRTGSATYFQTNERNASGTATRDMIVAKSAETRFGKWVMRIQDELAEAITMLVNIYQEHIPDNLGERILGEDGKALFRNLSVETLRYNADARMEPDQIAGSKAYERQVALWAAGFLAQSIWMDPRINPKGNWLLTADTMKKQGIATPERYLPPEPKPEAGTGKDIDGIWSRLMQGEVVEPEQTWNIPLVLQGLYKKKSEDFFGLDPEYRPNLDMLIFKTEMMYQEFVKKVAEEQMASMLAQRAIQAGQGGMPPQGGMMPPMGAPDPNQGIPEAPPQPPAMVGAEEAMGGAQGGMM